MCYNTDTFLVSYVIWINVILCSAQPCSVSLPLTQNKVCEDEDSTVYAETCLMKLMYRLDIKQMLQHVRFRYTCRHSRWWQGFQMKWLKAAEVLLWAYMLSHPPLKLSNNLDPQAHTHTVDWATAESANTIQVEVWIYILRPPLLTV